MCGAHRHADRRAMRDLKRVRPTRPAVNIEKELRFLFLLSSPVDFASFLGHSILLPSPLSLPIYLFHFFIISLSAANPKHRIPKLSTRFGARIPPRPGKSRIKLFRGRDEEGPSFDPSRRADDPWAAVKKKQERTRSHRRA